MSQNSEIMPESVYEPINEAAHEPAAILDIDQSASALDPVRSYFNEISRVPLLTAEEEVTISKRIEAGLYAGHLLANRAELPAKYQRQVKKLELLSKDGALAKQQLIEANLRLVVSIAKRSAGRGMDLLDLVQEGNIGLVRGVEKFDYRKGFKFSTYATWWIRQAISRGLAEGGREIRLPVHTVEVVNKVSRITRDLKVELSREPSLYEIAAAADLTPEKLKRVLRDSQKPISLQAGVGDEGMTVGDFIEDTDAPIAAEVVMHDDMKAKLWEAIETLDERERKVLVLRHGLNDGQPQTLDQIGKQIGLTRERIRQIESKALAKLRHPARSAALRDYASPE
ncbi:MAG: sigma-70 family RNA polymerase sigma factor [Patescibacteria group bacterium]|nr:sigma-70 family RNA polymerase sigma factor [Patescibacteria group bacterium]